MIGEERRYNTDRNLGTYFQLTAASQRQLPSGVSHKLLTHADANQFLANFLTIF